MECDVTFHPAWWSQACDADFSQSFFTDQQVRITQDVRMRHTLFERFGELGLGEQTPEPRPIVGSDLIACGYLFSQLAGCEVKFSPSGPPEVLCAHIDEKQIRALETVDVYDSPLWESYLRQISGLINDFGYIQQAINLQGVLNLALDLRGQQFFLDLYLDPDLARSLLRSCYRIIQQGASQLIKDSRTVSAGVTGITARIEKGNRLFVHSNCSVEMLSNEQYESFLLEYDNRLSTQFQPYGIHHCGSTTEHVVEGYSKVEALSFLEVGAGSNIQVVSARIPDAHLNLRYSPARLAVVSDEELLQEIQEMAHQADYRYRNISISCVGIGPEVEDDRVRAFLRHVSEL